ncbi:MAG: dTDP-4-dehydrorhamnose 3,5-epimerase [Pseudomonadota bacterium]
MQVESTPLPGVRLIRPAIHRDGRGYLQETWQQPRYAAAGIDAPFVQTNHAHSARHVLRGLHAQAHSPQGKLVYALRGTIWDVVADPRPDSASYGRWFGVELNDVEHTQLYVPPGYLHGFIVLSETADVLYQCTATYLADAQRGVRWDDDELAIDWPLNGAQPLLSAQDAALGGLADYNRAT